MNITFPLILDGAMGTQLAKAGLPRGVCPEQWALDNPQVVRDIQKAYLDAGSQVIYAPTFGANAVSLEKNGIYNQVEEYNQALVGISKSAAQGRALVAADLTSVGAMLYPMGDYSFEELYEIYEEQAKALEKAGVDLYVIETVENIAEARAAVLAVKSVSRKPIFVSFSCDCNGKTMMGSDVCAALQVLQGMGIDAFGLNCSVGPKELLVQLQRLSEYACIPLLAKPNAGLPQMVDGFAQYSVGPEEFASYVPAFAKAGVNLFGGCCGSDPSYIKAIKEALQGVAMQQPQPLHPELLPCATEKQVFMLDPSAACTQVFACDEELEDNLCELDEDELFGIVIETEEDAAAFSDIQYAIRNPLCLVCEDAELLEKALRAYQGRAIYDGGLPDEALLPLAEKYGLII